MVQLEYKDESLIARLEGELTYENATEIKEQIKEQISEQTARIVIDLSKLELIDSSGVGVFISLLRRMNGESVVLAAPQPQVARIFEITKLDLIMPIYATVEEALAR